MIVAEYYRHEILRVFDVLHHLPAVLKSFIPASVIYTSDLRTFFAPT